ncbi:MAG: amidohydrolase [Anaerolineae bacterium]|nr:amidohydrolase [Anaerolineae bacterium]
MIIDSHVHLKHGDRLRTEYTAEAIVQVMDEVGIDKSVVFAMSTTTQHSIEMAQEAVEQFPDRLIPYVYALPSYEYPALERIEWAISELGFKGIKIHLGECSLAEYVIDPVIDLAGRLKAPCLIDCMGRYDMIERMAKAFPDTKLIIAHMGRYLCTDESLIDRFIDLAQANPNIFLDVSGVVISWKIQDAVRRLGAGRVIFGTDGPHKKPDLATYARLELAKVKMLDLNPADEEMVLGGAIARLLGI